ncbi:hypothetical protein HK102_007847 [Quaeritorhiza haematococci]|nr:hypothetical protein HK102_007847 [Quaeritorhiza haematococci]
MSTSFSSNISSSSGGCSSASSWSSKYRSCSSSSSSYSATSRPGVSFSPSSPYTTQRDTAEPTSYANTTTQTNKNSRRNSTTSSTTSTYSASSIHTNRTTTSMRSRWDDLDEKVEILIAKLRSRWEMLVTKMRVPSVSGFRFRSANGEGRRRSGEGEDAGRGMGGGGSNRRRDSISSYTTRSSVDAPAVNEGSSSASSSRDPRFVTALDRFLTDFVSEFVATLSGSHPRRKNKNRESDSTTNSTPFREPGRRPSPGTEGGHDEGYEREGVPRASRVDRGKGRAYPIYPPEGPDSNEGEEDFDISEFEEEERRWSEDERFRFPRAASYRPPFPSPSTFLALPPFEYDPSDAKSSTGVSSSSTPHIPHISASKCKVVEEEDLEDEDEETLAAHRATAEDVFDRVFEELFGLHFDVDSSFAADLFDDIWMNLVCMQSACR